MPRLLPCALTAAVLLLGTAPQALAAADLGGNWRLPQDVFATCQQSGTDVACQFLPTLLSLQGTNDPNTGVFSFPVPPVPVPPGSEPVPPGPDGSFTGTVAPDGLSFTGTLTLSIWQGPGGWVLSPIPSNGTRFTGPGTCDNGIVEPGETCDQGSFAGTSLNGDTCCSASCTLVDPDGDLSCSRYDNCPATTNIDQADSNHDGIGDACDPSLGAEGPLSIEKFQVRYTPSQRGSLRLRASYEGTRDAPWWLGVSNVLCGNGMVLSTYTQNYVYQGLWAGRQCKTTKRGQSCRASFEGLKLSLKTREKASGAVEFDFKLSNTNFCSPGALAPVQVTLVHGGGARTATLTSCSTQVGATGFTYRTDCAP